MSYYVSNAIILTLAASVLTSLVALIGIITIFSKKVTEKLTYTFVAFAVGALIGDAFLHLIPEAAAELGEVGPVVGLTVLIGVVAFYILERIVHIHHLHVHTEHTRLHPVVINNLISDGLHNFVDGVAIAGSFLVSPTIGVATTIAVILHEVPQELGDFSILISKGLSFKRALWFNFLSASTAIAGAVVGLTIFERLEHILPYVLALIAGGFIYIALADLVPDLQLQRTKLNGKRGVASSIYAGFNSMTLIAMVAGIGIMYTLLFLE